MSRTDQGRFDDRDDTIAFDEEILSSLRRFEADRDALLRPGAGNDPIELRDRSSESPLRDIGPDEPPIAQADIASDPFTGQPCVEADPSSPIPSLKARKIRGNRGVDTLLRNSYRAQLDMLALAATKANIMISLNGLLMSMLVLSGTHFLSVDPWYIVPIGLFFLGCATATVFAVLAARPDVSQRTFQLDDFERDEARLLVFEEFSDLDETEYVDSMSRLLRDPTRVYRSMLAHVHDMGRMADRKFQRLYYSYTVFMTGFVLAAGALIVVQAFAWFASPLPV